MASSMGTGEIVAFHGDEPSHRVVAVMQATMMNLQQSALRSARRHPAAQPTTMLRYL